MPIITFNVHFAENETMPERLVDFAQSRNLTLEMLVRRALTAYLGDYGLTELPENFEAKKLEDFFVATGLLKPEQPGAPVKGDASHEPPQGSLDQ